MADSAIASTPRKDVEAPPAAPVPPAGGGLTVMKAGVGCALEPKIVFQTFKDGMKTAWCKLPQLYKGFYLKCPPKCGPVDRFDDVILAYYIHFCIALITWLVNLCIYASIIGGFDGMWVVSLLFILLNMWWSIHVCKHPEMCCLEQWFNALLFSIFISIGTIVCFVAMIDNFEYMSWGNKMPDDWKYADAVRAFVLPALLNIWDLTILIPMCTYSWQGVGLLIKENPNVKSKASAKVAPETS